MEIRKELGVSSNLHKALSVQSKLGVSGMDKMIRKSLEMESIGLKYDRIFNSGIYDVSRSVSVIANISKAIGAVENLSNNHYEEFIKPYSNIIRNIKTDYIRDISGMSKLLESIKKTPIIELNSSMKAWQTSMEFMPNNFLNNYNSIITKSMKSLTSGIIEMNQNMADFPSVSILNIDVLLPELAKINTFVYDEELEKEIDLKEVESIVYAKIEDINVSIKGENGDIGVTIRELNESIKNNGAKGGIINTIVSSVLAHLLIIFMTFIINSVNPYAPSDADIKHIIKSTKQIVRTMEVDNSFYNIFRVVTKDELEVRRSSKMKSGVKYYLNFGDLVQIEHKNKNWTKISYTNMFTDEREIGWVLTRYIKRLD